MAGTVAACGDSYASRDLIRQGSETLAGRIAFHELGGFRLSDVGSENAPTLWFRGGLPRWFLAESQEQSLVRRRQYIATFLERDIPQLGITIPARTLRRFWCIHGPPAGAVGDEHRETGGAEAGWRRTSGSSRYGTSVPPGTMAARSGAPRLWSGTQLDALIANDRLKEVVGDDEAEPY